MAVLGAGSVRCSAIDLAGLGRQEKHGKRLDDLSQKRRIREVDPLVYRTLDLCDAYASHMEGVKLAKDAKKPILHFIIHFPDELFGDDSPYIGSKLERQEQMLAQAVAFINETHGGDAVIAARVDLDEKGETIVDVFAAPKYEKRTKRTKPNERGPIWASATKFGRELALKHQDEIMRRHPEAEAALTGPRAVGIALQSEFAAFFLRENGVPLKAKREKLSSASDRLEKEAFERLQSAKEGVLAEIEQAQQQALSVIAEREASLQKQEAGFIALASEIVDETIYIGPDRKLYAKNIKPIAEGGKIVKQVAFAAAHKLDDLKRERAETKTLREKLSDTIQKLSQYFPILERLKKSSDMETRVEAVKKDRALKRDLDSTREFLSAFRADEKTHKTIAKEEDSGPSGPSM